MQHHEIRTTAHSLSPMTTIARDELTRASGGSPAGTAWDIAKNTGKAVGNGIGRAWYNWNKPQDLNGYVPSDYPKYKPTFRDDPAGKVRRDWQGIDKAAVHGAKSVLNHIKHWL